MDRTTVERRLYRVTEVARMCGLSRSMVYALIQRGELPVVWIGRTARIAADDIDALIRRHRVGPWPDGVQAAG